MDERKPRAPAQRIGELLPDVLKRVGQEHGALFGVQQRWPRLVGKTLAAHTRPVSLRRGQLVVAVDRPGDGFALSYQRADLLERLRRATNSNVSELIIRPGRGTGARE